jgi:hypothetical protein
MKSNEHLKSEKSLQSNKEYYKITKVTQSKKM